MSERKIIKFIRDLTKSEAKAFNDFVLSPYFNKNESLVKFHNITIKYIDKKIKPEKLERFYEKEFTKLDINYSKSLCDKYFSNLYTLALEFASLHTIKKDKKLVDIQLMKFFSNKKDFSNHEKYFDKISEDLINQPDSTSKFYELIRLYSDALNVFHKSNNRSRIEKTNKSLIYFLDIHYIVKKYFNQVQNLIGEDRFNTKFKIHFSEILLNSVEKTEYIKEPIIACWHYAFQFLNSKDLKVRKENFEKFIFYCNSHISKFCDVTKNNFYTIVENYVSTVFEDKSEYYNFKFNHYKEQLNNGGIYFHGMIFAQSVKNIVNISLKLSEFDWLDQFLEEHKEKIVPKSEQNDILLYSTALIAFYKKEYRKCDDLIRNLHFKNVFYRISVKRLELMVNFELKEWLYLDSLINAFRVSLTPARAKSIPENHRIYNNNFLNFFALLYRNGSGTKSFKMNEIEKTYQKLNDELKISSKDWLQSKFQVILSKTSIDQV